MMEVPSYTAQISRDRVIVVVLRFILSVPESLDFTSANVVRDKVVLKG